MLRRIDELVRSSSFANRSQAVEQALREKLERVDRGREQAGRRPVVIISQDVFNERSGTVIAMALTSQPQRAGLPLTHELPKPLLGKRAWVKISQVRTLPVERIGARIGILDAAQLDRLVDGLRETVDR